MYSRIFGVLVLVTLLATANVAVATDIEKLFWLLSVRHDDLFLDRTQWDQVLGAKNLTTEGILIQATCPVSFPRLQLDEEIFENYPELAAFIENNEWQDSQISSLMKLLDYLKKNRRLRLLFYGLFQDLKGYRQEEQKRFLIQLAERSHLLEFLEYVGRQNLQQLIILSMEHRRFLPWLSVYLLYGGNRDVIQKVIVLGGRHLSFVLLSENRSPAEQFALLQQIAIVLESNPWLALLMRDNPAIGLSALVYFHPYHWGLTDYEISQADHHVCVLIGEYFTLNRRGALAHLDRGIAHNPLFHRILLQLMRQRPGLLATVLGAEVEIGGVVFDSFINAVVQLAVSNPGFVAGFMAGGFIARLLELMNSPELMNYLNRLVLLGEKQQAFDLMTNPVDCLRGRIVNPRTVKQALLGLLSCLDYFFRCQTVTTNPVAIASLEPLLTGMLSLHCSSSSSSCTQALAVMLVTLFPQFEGVHTAEQAQVVLDQLLANGQLNAVTVLALVERRQLNNSDAQESGSSTCSDYSESSDEETSSESESMEESHGQGVEPGVSSVSIVEHPPCEQEDPMDMPD